MKLAMDLGLNGFYFMESNEFAHFGGFFLGLSASTALFEELTCYVSRNLALYGCHIAYFFDSHNKLL